MRRRVTRKFVTMKQRTNRKLCMGLLLQKMKRKKRKMVSFDFPKSDFKTTLFFELQNNVVLVCHIGKGLGSGTPRLEL